MANFMPRIAAPSAFEVIRLCAARVVVSTIIINPSAVLYHLFTVAEIDCPEAAPMPPKQVNSVKDKQRQKSGITVDVQIA
jgi:hypothetical protein